MHKYGLEQSWIYTNMVEKELWRSQEACTAFLALSDSPFLYLKIEITEIIGI